MRVFEVILIRNLIDNGIAPQRHLPAHRGRTSKPGSSFNFVPCRYSQTVPSPPGAVQASRAPVAPPTFRGVSLSAHRVAVTRSYSIWRHQSLALEVGAGAEKCYTRVHDCLANPEVAFKPLLGAGVLAECIWLYTGTGFSFSSDRVVVGYL